MEVPAITVAIIDDHKMLRQGIRMILEAEPGMKVVGDAANGLEGLDLLKNKKPDVALVDIMMEGMNGIELTRHVCQEIPETRVIILSMLDGQAYIDQSLKAGARGYVIKGAGIEDLISAIHTVHSGQPYLSSILIKKGAVINRQIIL